MKLYAVAAVILGAAFAVYTGIQVQVQTAESEREAAEAPPPPPPPRPKRLNFPADLAPAAQGKAVPAAAAFAPGPKPHKITILRPDATLHPWHADLDDDWQATSVEATELVLVIGKQKKILLETVPFRNGPPIDRWEYDLTVTVVEPTTGVVVARQRFRNVARGIRSPEAYATTSLGQPLRLPAVLRWVRRMTAIGFPDEHDPAPIVTTIDS